MCEILNEYKPIGIIGSGNMGTALMTGLVSSKLVDPKDIIASNSRHSELAKLKEKGITICPDNTAVALSSKTIILAVKPNLINTVVSEIKGCLNKKLLISVASGITVESIEKLTDASVIRVMPNTAVAIREGCVAVTPGATATQLDIDACKAIFGSVSKVSEVVSEDNMDSMIGVSGSGIAYMYVVAEALIDAGVKMGLPRDISKNFVAQTLVGAGKMIQVTGEHPMVLKDRVTSPGGTTICGIAKLEELGLRNALIKAAEAAKERAQKH